MSDDAIKELVALMVGDFVDRRKAKNKVTYERRASEPRKDPDPKHPTGTWVYI